MKEYPVIIIGAGIGGLTVAAYLKKKGIPALILEQGSIPGGRCSTRRIGNCNYEIGALYIGGGVYDNLKTEFGIEPVTIPVRCYIRIHDSSVSFPLSWKTLLELKSCGVSWIDLIKFLAGSRILSNAHTFEKYKSVGEILDSLTSNKTLRGFFDAVFGVSGISPYQLPSRYLYTQSELVKYKTDSPAYIPGGNGRIAELLYQFSKNNCEFHFGENVEEIIIENGRAAGIITSKKKYNGKIIVSNAGIRRTVMDLTKKDNWSDDYYNDVADQRETLSVVNIFIRFSSLFKFPDKYAVFFLSEDININFSKLEEGSFPENPMFILHVPSNIEENISGEQRGTLQFYFPRGNLNKKDLEKQVDYIMTAGLEKLFSGLSKAVIDYVVYDPVRYKKEFCFSPVVFGISPEYTVSRFPVETGIENLYCVGDSVYPDGPCVPQAMESGLICARNICSKIG